MKTSRSKKRTLLSPPAETSFRVRFGYVVRLMLAVALCLGVVGGILLFAVNETVKGVGKGRILSPEEAEREEPFDCILVLGCFAASDGTPSPMLHDRVVQGVSLYQAGCAPILFLSGDNKAEDYDEIGAMRRLALNEGVEREAIREDPYGLSTYDSIVRAAEVYGYRRVLIVTQEYHLYRALYIAEKVGLDAYGVASDPREYAGQLLRDLREIAARAKDVVYCSLRPQPEMGTALPN